MRQGTPSLSDHSINYGINSVSQFVKLLEQVDHQLVQVKEKTRMEWSMNLAVNGNYLVLSVVVS